MLIKTWACTIAVAFVALAVISQISFAQTKPILVSGNLFRVHAGFLEVRTDVKTVTAVKVDSATIYWNGKTDKAASARDLMEGDELIIEVIEKKGLLVAQKVRFLHQA